MKKFRNMKKTFAAFMSFILVATIIPASVFAANEADSVVEKTETLNGTTYTVWDSSIPEDVNLSLEEVDSDSLDLEAYEIEKASDITTAVDIKLLNEDETEWQPDDTVNVSIDAASLGLEDGDTVVIKHNHEGDISSLGEYVVADEKITFETDGFSIYVVVGTYANDWNYNNYQIMMTVGDSLEVSTSTNGNSYAWSIISGDEDSFTLTNYDEETATITANELGSIELQCVITSWRGNSTTEKMKVVALNSVGTSVDDDIIFANIDKAYVSGDTEYENTYGPYTMKIRFEDDEGNLLKYSDGTTVGEEYYVFDSEAIIDVNTFAAVAPEGYTYAGAFFYWSGHYTGDKCYVTSIERDNNNTATGSHLYFNGQLQSSGQGRWTYQASGVLHVVYVPTNDVYTVVFKDHCGYELANYALPFKYSGATFPSGYIDNITNMKNLLIPNHHNSHDLGYEFSDNWIVTGGGSGIDGSYTTAELINKIGTWKIKNNIVIQAKCSETNVTINYKAVTEDGGSVSIPAETLKASSGNAQGSVATVNNGYNFEGWYSDENCTQKVSDDAAFVPAKINGVNVAATYYAKFVEKKVNINYVPVGGGVVDNDTETINKVTGTATGSTPTANAGYTFEGWYTDQNCENKVESSLVGANNKLTPTKDANEVWPDTTTYYAKFVELESTINYVVKDNIGGTVTPASETIGRATGTADGSKAAAAEGYRFDGWYADETCTGTPLSTSETYKPIKSGETWPETSTYYAKFVELDAEINYVVEGGIGGSVSLAEEFVKKATGVAEGSTATAAAGYDFVGWYDSEGNEVSKNSFHKPQKPENIWPDKSTYYARFAEQKVTLTYVAVGPEGAENFGDVSPASEEVNRVTGEAEGSTATASAPTFKFVGWYDNPECTGTALSTAATYVPVNPDGMWEEATYYAKFEYNLADLTITKAGIEPVDHDSVAEGAIKSAEESQSTIFQITGPNDYTQQVVIHGNDSVTIENLIIGEYTVTEITDWSWRYVPTDASQTVTLVAPSDDTAEVEFNNKRFLISDGNNKWKWLNGGAYCENLFDGSN